MHQILTIFPYRHGDHWAFDDAQFGLSAEPFVFGMSEIITRVVENKKITRPENGFCLQFSDSHLGFGMHEQPDVQLEWLCAACGGNWYTANVYGFEMLGWLCPALYRYFKTAPQTIYARAS